MTFFIEFGMPALRPGWFRSRIGGKRFYRFWCLWFAFAVYMGDLTEYGGAMKGCEWLYENKWHD